MKFLLNENIPPSLVQFFHPLGHHAVHVKDVGLLGTPDEKIFNYAFENEFVIVTHDLDYSHIHAYSGKAKPSVILFRMDALSKEKMQNVLSAHLKKLESDLQDGSFVVIEEVQIRVRKLPISRT